MKKINILIIITFILFIVTGCSKNVVNEDAIKFKNSYEALNCVETSTEGRYYRSIEIDEDNPIVYTTFKEVKDMIENEETFILYVGFSSCPWCRTVIPYIIEEANENNIDKIYYINVREDNTKESDLRGYYELDNEGNVIYSVYPDKYYHDVLNTLDDFLTPYTLTDKDNNIIETGENRLYAPSLIAYKKGVPVALDECISDKQTDGYQELTDEIINDMKEKINTLFATYKENNKCDSSEAGCK